MHMMHCCISTPTTDNNTSTGIAWVTVNMGRSAANRQEEKDMELSRYFTLSGEWSPCRTAAAAATRKATRPEGVENDASARPPNLSSVLCDLDLWHPDPQSWSFHALARDQLCQLASKWLRSFQNIVFASLVTIEQTTNEDRLRTLCLKIWRWRRYGNGRAAMLFSLPI